MVDEIRRLLTYDLDTGILRWTDNASRNKGLQAGTLYNKRLRVRVAGEMYYAETLAFLLGNGVWPKITPLHIDCDPLNNRLDNLDEVGKVAALAAMRRQPTEPYRAQPGYLPAFGKRYVDLEAAVEQDYLSRRQLAIKMGYDPDQVVPRSLLDFV